MALAKRGDPKFEAQVRAGLVEARQVARGTAPEPKAEPEKKSAGPQSP